MEHSHRSSEVVFNCSVCDSAEILPLHGVHSGEVGTALWAIANSDSACATVRYEVDPLRRDETQTA